MTHSSLSAPSLALAFLLTAVAGLPGCKARASQNDVVTPVVSSAAEPELVLQAYDVPAGQAEQVAAVLHNVFAGLKERAVARATASPDGQLLVVGTSGIQQGVAAILTRMEGRTPPPPPTIEMNYWFVVAERASETVLGPGLQEIAPALEAVALSQGPLRFSKVEGARIRSLSEEQGEANGRFTAITQRASVNGDKIIADVELVVMGGSRLETRLAMAPDQVLILGETGVNEKAIGWTPASGETASGSPEPGQEASRTEPLILFYVVRATTHGVI